MLFQPFSSVYLVITLERFELFDIFKSFGISHPLNSLPCCHNPDIFHRHNRIKKQLESFLVVRSCKPEIGRGAI